MHFKFFSGEVLRGDRIVNTPYKVSLSRMVISLENVRIAWLGKKICGFPISSCKNLGRVGRF